MTEDSVAQRALTTAKVTEQALKSHEDLCLERYTSINTKIEHMETSVNGKVDELGTVVKRFTFGLIALLITVLGWSVKMQIDTNNAQRDAAAAKIELMQRQLGEDRQRP